MNHGKHWVWAVVLSLAASTGWSQSPEEIVRKAQELGAFNMLDVSAELRLVTTPAQGPAREQVVSVASKKIQGRIHTLARFVQPAPVAGVAFLVVEGQGGQTDELSLFLPKIKRVRKVAAAERNKSFMDTDFSYSDFSAAQVGMASAERLADDKVDGRACFVVKAQAPNGSEYGTVTVYVDQQTFVPLRADYADKNGKPFKKYQASKLKKFKKRVLASEVSMENLQTGSKTKVEIRKLQEGALSDEDFTERALERG